MLSYVLTHFSPCESCLAALPGAFHISNKQNKSSQVPLLFLLIRVCVSFFAKRIHFSLAAAAALSVQHLDRSNVLGTKDARPHTAKQL